MKLLDRLALHKAISLVLNFILSILKIFVPSKTEDNIKPIRRRGRPRKNQNE